MRKIVLRTACVLALIASTAYSFYCFLLWNRQNSFVGSSDFIELSQRDVLKAYEVLQQQQLLKEQLFDGLKITALIVILFIIWFLKNLIIRKIVNLREGKKAA